MQTINTPSSRLRNHPLILIALAILSTAFFCVSCVNDPDPHESDLQPGDPCAEFRTELSDSTIFSPSLFRGHGGMIVFFNTSCSDCREELPRLQEAYTTLQAEGNPSPELPGFNIICISRAEGAASVSAYWSAEGLTLPYAACDDRSIYNLFAPAVIPRIYLIDADLRIVRIWTDTNMPSSATLLAAIRSL